MSGRVRALAALAAAVAVGMGGAAGAGELINSYLAPVPLNPSIPGVQFFNTDFSSGGPAFTLPHQARGLAVGADNSIHASISGSIGNFVLKYDLDGDLTDGIILSSDHTPGPLAFGNDTLFLAYSSELGGVDAVGFYNPDFTFQGGFIQTPQDITGLAFGNDSLFLAYGSVVQQYDLHGQLLQSVDFVSYSIGALAFGEDTLFMAYTQNLIFEVNRGIAYLDAATLLGFEGVDTGDERARGLAYGEGGLFASFEYRLARYDMAGDQTDSLVTGIFGMGIQNGPLAFIADTQREPPCVGRLCQAPGVPEPSAWALMIIGFGGVGAALRTRRRTGQGAAWI